MLTKKGMAQGLQVVTINQLTLQQQTTGRNPDGIAQHDASSPHDSACQERQGMHHGWLITKLMERKHDGNAAV